MEGNEITLAQVTAAFEARDPGLVDLLRSLSQQPIVPEVIDGEDDAAKPPRQDAMDFAKFLAEIRSPEFRKKTPEEQEHFRIAQLRALEADSAEVPMSDRLRAHEILLTLWEGGADPFCRTMLLRSLRLLPFSYGVWRGMKRIFKEAEERDDTEVFGLLAARFDTELSNHAEVSKATLMYLCRRAWRYLRRVGESLPACYADVACDYLAAYQDPIQYSQRQSWVFNHIFFHETGDYTRQRFRKTPPSKLKYRAFGDLWRRSPRPLFSLIERALSEAVREYACAALKSDFRTSLRDVEPEWVARLAAVDSPTVHEFAVWILENVPRFEQSSFRELGLHEPVLSLFNSESSKAKDYAASYARTHARDLDFDTLVRLIDSDRPSVKTLASDLISDRDPRKEIGLDGWGRLLETHGGYQLAAAAIRKHFGASELTPEWFRERLLSVEDLNVFAFNRELLLKLHPRKKLGVEYFCELVDTSDPESYMCDEVCSFAMENITAKDELDPEFLKRCLLNPNTAGFLRMWMDEGRIEAHESFDPGFLKIVAFHPDWESSEWVAELKKTHRFARDLEFNEHLSTTVLDLLSDVRKFSPDKLGFDWLMKLVERSEPRYHNFAVETMIKAFLPADFAPKEEEPEPAKKKTAKKKTAKKPKVDLKGQSFVFTGKLNTMTRGEAKKKVTDAKGKNGSGVSKNLDFLVIGDEGSPLYGQGRKGSKQLKGESVIADGADLKIISETAFLQMLSGEERKFGGDEPVAGCKRLWEMMVAPGTKPDAPLAKFALQYFRRHHPEISLEETDRPVDPGAEIPDEFLTFEQLKPLFGDERPPLRAYALELAKYEFARWAPPIEGIIDLCEIDNDEVREFVGLALTADGSQEHKRYRIEPAVLTADAVYRFCESNNAATRALGMHLIDAHPRLRLPEELFRLTESPDSNVRAFVVRNFWSIYRDRGTTPDWKPELPPQVSTGARAKQNADEAAELLGDGTPARPENPPADFSELQTLLRRVLYELPPGRPDGRTSVPSAATLKPLPNRKAKLFLIETLRDLAMEDREFADIVLPLLREFMGSRGMSEQAACLVAVTRIGLKWKGGAA